MIYPRSSPRYIIYERVRVENGVLWKFGKVSEFVLPPTEISLWNSIHRPSSIEDKPTSDRYILSPSSVTLHTIWNNLFIPYTAIIKSFSWMHRSKGAINSTNTIKILLFISRLLVDLEKKKYIGDISRRSPFDIYPRRTIPSRKGNIEGKGEIDYRLTNYLIRVESKFKRPRK